MAPRISSPERIQRRSEALKRWKNKNWEKYIEQKRRLESTPEYLAKRRIRYAESVQHKIPRSKEDALERRRHLSKLRSREYRQRVAERDVPTETAREDSSVDFDPLRANGGNDAS